MIVRQLKCTEGFLTKTFIGRGTCNAVFIKERSDLKLSEQEDFRGYDLCFYRKRPLQSHPVGVKSLRDL